MMSHHTIEQRTAEEIGLISNEIQAALHQAENISNDKAMNSGGLLPTASQNMDSRHSSTKNICINDMLDKDVAPANIQRPLNLENLKMFKVRAHNLGITMYTNSTNPLMIPPHLGKMPYLDEAMNDEMLLVNELWGTKEADQLNIQHTFFCAAIKALKPRTQTAEDGNKNIEVQLDSLADQISLSSKKSRKQPLESYPLKPCSPSEIIRVNAKSGLCSKPGSFSSGDNLNSSDQLAINKERRTDFLTCSICKENFENDKLVLHMISAHGFGALVKVEYFCRACNDCICTHSEAVIEHVLDCHLKKVIPLNPAKVMLFSCQECTFVCNNSRSIAKHMVLRHCALYVCAYHKCNKFFETFNMLLKHVVTHTYVLHRSKLCDYYTQDKSKAIEHDRLHIVKDVLLCHHCGEFFQTASEFSSHKKSLSLSKTYFRCNNCNLCCPDFNMMMAHCSTTKANLALANTCKHCQKLFVDSEALCEHDGICVVKKMKITAKEQRFACPSLLKDTNVKKVLEFQSQDNLVRPLKETTQKQKVIIVFPNQPQKTGLQTSSHNDQVAILKDPSLAVREVVTERSITEENQLTQTYISQAKALGIEICTANIDGSHLPKATLNSHNEKDEMILFNQFWEIPYAEEAITNLHVPRQRLETSIQPQKIQLKVISTPTGELFGLPVSQGTTSCPQGNTSQRSKIFKCALCHLMYISEKQLCQHLVLKHGFGTFLRVEFQCRICNSTFVKLRKAVDHFLRGHFEKMSLPIGKKLFSCLDCTKTFEDTSSISKHQVISHCAKYSCGGCLEKFATFDVLLEHVAKHTDSNFYESSRCNLSSYDAVEVEKHVKDHKEEDTYVCHHCSLSFDSSEISLFQKHILEHTASKILHRCGNCDLYCPDYNMLMAHKKAETSGFFSNEPLIIPKMQSAPSKQFSVDDLNSNQAGQENESGNAANQQLKRKAPSLVNESFQHQNCASSEFDNVDYGLAKKIRLQEDDFDHDNFEFQETGQDSFGLESLGSMSTEETFSQIEDGVNEEIKRNFGVDKIVDKRLGLNLYSTRRNVFGPNLSFGKSGQHSENKADELIFVDEFWNVGEEIKIIFMENENDGKLGLRPIFPKEPISLLSCHYCDMKFRNPKRRQQHMIVHHGMGTFVRIEFLCKFCEDRTFVRLERAIQHFTQHIVALIPSSPATVMLYSCRECTFVCNEAKIIGKHIILRHSVRLSCVACSKNFQTLDLLVEHICTHKDFVFFKSRRCDFYSFDENLVFQHCLDHENENQYMCHYCNRSFDLLKHNKYIRHMEEHLYDRKVHKCGKCGLLLPDYNMFIVHYVAEAAGKYLTLSCTLCGHPSDNQNAWVAHVEKCKSKLTAYTQKLEEFQDLSFVIDPAEATLKIILNEDALNTIQEGQAMNTNVAAINEASASQMIGPKLLTPDVREAKKSFLDRIPRTSSQVAKSSNVDSEKPYELFVLDNLPTNKVQKLVVVNEQQDCLVCNLPLETLDDVQVHYSLHFTPCCTSCDYPSASPCSSHKPSLFRHNINYFEVFTQHDLYFENSNSLKCDVCNFKLKNEKLSEMLSKLSKCPHCPFWSMDRRIALMHLIAHETFKKCQMCPFYSCSYTSLQQHIKAKHCSVSKGKVHKPKCPYCKKQLSKNNQQQPSNYAEHIQVCPLKLEVRLKKLISDPTISNRYLSMFDLENRDCHFCQLEFPNHEELTKHALQHPLHLCPICFIYEFFIEEHIRSCHLDNLDAVVPSDSLVMDAHLILNPELRAAMVPYILNMDQQMVEESLIISSENEKYCQICKLPVGQDLDIRAHFTIHFSPCCLQCQTNGRCDQHKRLLFLHDENYFGALTQHHLVFVDNSYKCTKCKVTFIGVEIRMALLKIFGMYYQCEECHFYTKRKDDFILHKLEHESLKKCNLCSFQSYSSNKVSEHVETHHQRKMKCPECFLVVKSERSLMCHLRLCKDLLFYKLSNTSKLLDIEANFLEMFCRDALRCDFCNLEFRDYRSEQKHFTRWHPKIVCSVCGMVQEDIGRHTAEKHPEFVTKKSIQMRQLLSIEHSPS